MAEPLEILQNEIIRPEFGSIGTTNALFGLSKSEIYDLIKNKKIEAKQFFKPGSKRGIYIVRLDSVRAYMNRLMEDK
jgi:hypothetical protein